MEEFPLEVWLSLRSEPRTGKYLVQGHQSAKEVCAEGEEERVRWGFGVWVELLPGIEDGVGVGLSTRLPSSWVVWAEKNGSPLPAFYSLRRQQE